MRFVTSLIAVAWLGLSGAAFAQNTVFVELFTSQGCSSCPPADAMLHELAERDDVIALSLHVDYWDYIGWKDEFADPSHAKRQRAYARVAGRRSIYTPQMIVNGQTDIVGAKPMKLSKAISAYQVKPSLAMQIARSGQGVSVSASPEPGINGPFVVYMAYYQSERKSRITRGENAGHTLVYTNVAEDLTILGEWDGATPLQMEIAADEGKPIVVWLQQGAYGPILGAARLR